MNRDTATNANMEADRALSPHLPPRNIRSYLVFRVASVSGGLIHVALIPTFFLMGVDLLAWVNFLSAAIYGVVISLNYRGHYHLGMALAVFEIIVHQTLAVHYLGLDAGFQYYLFAAGSVVFFLPPERRFIRELLFLASLTAFVVLISVYSHATPVASVRPVIISNLGYVNLTGVFAVLGIIAFSYSRAATHAEAALEEAHEQSERLLHNILPVPIAERLKASSEVIADGFPDATVLFADIVGFTPLSEQRTPREVVTLLNEIFSAFDDLVTEQGLEKIKTIGDAYMVAAGVPEARVDHAQAIAELALDMRRAMGERAPVGGTPLRMRIGINSGSVVAGVIGKQKFIYDLWGDAVNTAARMESHGEPGEIQVTEATWALLADGYEFRPRGTVEIKGKGPMKTWFLEGRAGKTEAE